MKTDITPKCKILVLSFPSHSSEKERRLSLIKNELLQNYKTEFIQTNNAADFAEALNYQQDITTIFIEYDVTKPDVFKDMLSKIRQKNKHLPIIAFSEKRILEDFNITEFTQLSDFYFLYVDTPDFLAGRMMEYSKKYLEIAIPPFLKQLMDYSAEYKYAWHTPGHMGGCAFTKSPSGNMFYNFLGENVFRSDLSISVPGLGSLLDHEGPIGDSEKFASKVFGSDKTYYVLNGTSSVNQIIWRGRVTTGDLAFVDRNCHKSLNYAMTITEAIPTYMVPRRNGMGIIGPVKLEEFTADYITNAVKNNPIVPAEKKATKVKMSTLTNSTYDGLCYNVTKIKETLCNNVENMHFDEAWYAYAKFHPIYKDFFAMTDDVDTKPHPPIFASHSTHKLLAALSQASMLHVKDGTTEKIDHEIFNEAYMMYSSTSPQYNMIASLDVSANMMNFNGENLINDTIVDAISLRKKIVKMKSIEEANGSWFFDVWQPETTTVDGQKVEFKDADDNFLAKDKNSWILKANESWHGFEDIEEDYVMLDPIKITIKMPGLKANGTFEEDGIPASIVSDYLMDCGVVAEKTDYYSLLLLNSMGTTKSKQNSLIIGLSHFKELYDQNAPLDIVFPALVATYPQKYKGVGLKDHCQNMHKYLKTTGMLNLMARAFESTPTPVLTPAEAARKLFKGEVEKVKIAEARDRMSAVMVVPYPPGIPMIMGGEKFDETGKAIIDYLLSREAFELEFPGYYSDIHGIEVVEEDGKRIFTTMVLK